MAKGKLTFTITGEIEINENLDDLRAALECLDEAVEKAREWGKASLEYDINAKGGDRG